MTSSLFLLATSSFLSISAMHRGSWGMPPTGQGSGVEQTGGEGHAVGDSGVTHTTGVSDPPLDTWNFEEYLDAIDPSISTRLVDQGPSHSGNLSSGSHSISDMGNFHARSSCSQSHFPATHGISVEMGQTERPEYSGQIQHHSGNPPTGQGSGVEQTGGEGHAVGVSGVTHTAGVSDHPLDTWNFEEYLDEIDPSNSTRPVTGLGQTARPEYNGQIQDHSGNPTPYVHPITSSSQSSNFLEPSRHSSNSHNFSGAGYQQSDQSLGTPMSYRTSCTHGEFISDAANSSQGSSSSINHIDGGYQNTLPSAINMESSANQSIPVMVFQSSGIPVSDPVSVESREAQVNVFGNMPENSVTCLAANFDDYTYTVCPTDDWSKLDLSIEQNGETEKVSCDLTKVRRTSFHHFLVHAPFQFKCNRPSTDLDTIVEMSRPNEHRIKVDLETKQFQGEPLEGWIPRAAAFAVSSKAVETALCGSIPLFNGSIGVVALKKGRHPGLTERAQKLKDLFIRTTFARLPETHVTQDGQFDVLISNGNAHLLYRGVDSSPSTSLYSIFVREPDNKLIVQLPQAETKEIKLVNCKELGPRGDTGRTLDEDLKMMHSSIIRTVMTSDMVDEDASNLNAGHLGVGRRNRRLV